MHVGANLTPQQFSNVHNALYYLRCVRDKIETKFGSEGAKDILEEIEKQENVIREQFADAYRKDNEMFQSLMDHYDAAGKTFDARTTWSMYEVPNMRSKHPYVGAGLLLHKHHWGEKPITVEIKGDTWLDLYQAADEAIRASEDLHHSFIEGFDYNEEEGQLILHTGSYSLKHINISQECPAGRLPPFPAFFLDFFP